MREARGGPSRERIHEVESIRFRGYPAASAYVEHETEDADAHVLSLPT